MARERLRSRLVDLRGRSGLSPETVTGRTHWSLSKLHRIETGAVGVQPLDVQALLRIYGVRDPAEVARLTDLAVVARRRPWWSGSGVGDGYREFIGYESEASRITVYQALLLPALLQTEGYARAVTSSIVGTKPDEAMVRRLVDVRLRRQAELFARMRGPEPPRLVALLDGAVLERPVGGAEVMRAQLDHLLGLLTHECIRLVVVPLRHGVHPSLGGAFELMEFAGSGDPDVVFVESTVKDFVVKDADVTASYHDVVAAVVAAGLTRDAAADEIRRVRGAL